MEQFTIRDIENLTGIKAHTIRIWEQRYPKLIQKQEKSKHRLYSNEDLKRFLRISFLYHNGCKISQLAEWSDEEILQKSNSLITEPGSYSLFLLQLLEAALDFDEYRFVGILETITASDGFENCIAEVCYPFLKKIGLLWMTNHVIPAQEHFASSIILKKIIAKTDELPLNTQGPVMVVFSPSGEHHELPLLFINYVLRKWGWNTIYLGTDIKLETLQHLKTNTSIEYFYLHIITNFTGFLLDDYFDSLQQMFPSIKLVASGIALNSMQRQFTNLTPLKTDAAIHAFIQQKGLEYKDSNSR